MSKYRNMDVINASVIRSVLAGGRRGLYSAFIWQESPEGFDYWNDVYISGKLSSGARSKLQAMLRHKEKAAT